MTKFTIFTILVFLVSLLGTNFALSCPGCPQDAKAAMNQGKGCPHKAGNKRFKKNCDGKSKKCKSCPHAQAEQLPSESQAQTQ